MKKIIFFIVIIIALTSCQKDEVENCILNKTSNFQIYFSEGGEKSSGINIGHGDTIDLYRNLPAIFWATNLDGSPAKINWDINQSLSDDPPHVFSAPKSFFRDQISYKPADAGYYQFFIAEHPNGPTVFSFTAYVATPQPGLIGDDFQNDFIFRMEKKYYPATGENKLFVYFKYSQDYNEEEVGATLGGWPPGGLINVDIIRYPFAKTRYSDDPYFYFILDIPEGTSSYQAGVHFWGPYGIDSNAYLSDWSNDKGEINFQINN
jgi:hypothetical protein